MITPDLRRVLEGRPSQTRVKVLVDPTPDGVGDVRSRLRQVGNGFREVTVGSETVFQTTLNRQQIQQFAGLNSVERVDHAPTFQPLGAAPAQTPQADVTRLTTGQTTAMLDVEEAWDISGRGGGASIGIVDSPVDTEHPAYADNIAGVGGPEGKDPHGTWVAGCIAADESETEVGTVRGIAPDADLYVHGALSGGAATVADVIDGIDWCIQQGVDIINMSFGGPHSEVFHTAIEEVANNDIIPVTAAGNAGPALDSMSCPAHHEETVSVAATNGDGNTSLFSSRGPGWNGIDKPDVSAPGGDASVVGGEIGGIEAIVSTAPDGKFTPLLGTSMAAPHVAGLIALGSGEE